MKRVVGSAVVGTMLAVMLASGFGAGERVASADESVNAGSDVAIDATNFPDAKFRKCVSEFDLDGNGKLSRKEISQVINIACHDSVTSMKGVEFFTELKTLNCGDNQLTELDVSKLSQLTDLYAHNNLLTSLDTSHNLNLQVLNCSGNMITDMDISKNTQLTMFVCSANQLTSLDLSQNTKLEYFECTVNHIKKLDLSKNTQLIAVWCSDNQIASLTFGANKKLTSLYCNNNVLTSLDLRKCSSLEEVECHSNQLTDILTSNQKLDRLECSYNQLTSLDVSGDSHLLRLSCRENPITSLDLSKNTELTYLDCYYDALTSLDVSKNSDLAYLCCDGNAIGTLDISKNTNLQILACNECGLKSINVGKNLKLTDLYCGNNQLTSLDVSNDTGLRTLRCSENKLTKLDISKNTELTELYCIFNELGSLDISQNTKLERLNCDNTNLSSLDTSKNVNMTWLSCNYNQLKSLDVSHSPELQCLYVAGNILSKLDLSKNPKLIDLDCMNNQIASLDVSQQTDLHDLMCANNKISKLDLSKNTGLAMLVCGSNPIKTLDVKNCPELVYFDCKDMKLSELDLSNNLKVGILLTDMNNIAELDIREHDFLADRISRATWEEDDSSYTAILYEDVSHDSHYYLQAEGYTFTFDKSTRVLADDPSILPSPSPSPSVTPTPTPTPAPATPTPTTAPGQPTPTTAPGQPTPTTAPGQPTPAPSSGSIADFVERLYTVALGRPSEKAGKDFWVKEITSGNRTGADCAREFLFSQEFTNRNLSIEDFVETLYQTFFGRDSEPNGKAYWVGELKNGTKSRNDVINGFIDSTEWCNICADYGVKSGAPSAKAERASKNAIDFATRLYTCCLGREPEEGGLKFWSLALTNLEKTGAQAAQLFFESQEYIDLATGDKEFISRLYTTFMDRSAEAEGMYYWLARLKEGVSRREVLAWFAQSPEFTEVCKRYGIDRGSVDLNASIPKQTVNIHQAGDAILEKITNVAEEYGWTVTKEVIRNTETQYGLYLDFDIECASDGEPCSSCIVIKSEKTNGSVKIGVFMYAWSAEPGSKNYDDFTTETTILYGVIEFLRTNGVKK